MHALGVAVWPMVEFEADDALAAAAGGGAPIRGGAGRHLHARQRPRANRSRHPRRPAQPADESHARRSGCRREIRRASRVDSRLARARWRLGRWLSRSRRLGREVRGGRPGTLRPSRGHPGRFSPLEGQREEPGHTRGDAGGQSRSRAPVPHPRHAPRRPSAVRRCGAGEMARANPAVRGDGGVPGRKGRAGRRPRRSRSAANRAATARAASSRFARGPHGWPVAARPGRPSPGRR